MNNKQRSIKGFAIALATMFAVIIIGVIILGAYSLISWFSPSSNGTFDEGIDYNKVFDADEITDIVIDNSVGKLTLKQGDVFEVTGENVLEDFSCDLMGNKLVIEHNSNKMHGFTNFSETSIAITIPDDIRLESIEIISGVDYCAINDIRASRFTLEAGVGNADISNLTSDSVTIEGGVGNININDSDLGSLDMECGVGNASISGRLNNCTVISGVGEVNLDIDGDYEDYDIDISAGVGNVRINGERYKGDTRLNRGAENKLEIEGGVGNITINFH